MFRLSVIIKTFNEEDNIERAIESSLDATSLLGGEVIVADSASTDRTVERAAQYPVTVVCLSDPTERCCGVGPQLGYQYCTGEYVYILDGDMQLDSSFVSKAVDQLDGDPSVAGVGGIIREMRVENLEFQTRVERQKRSVSGHTVQVHSLGGGGLYRRQAIEEGGYMSDRNLHAFEEYDLGVRLRAAGWTLTRLQEHAADHYSYTLGTSQLLWYRIKTGSTLSVGELLRAAIAGRYLYRAVLELKALRVAIGVWFYWCIVGLALWIATRSWTAFWLGAIACLFPIAAMSVRRRSLKIGAYSVLLWHVNAIGLVFGALRARKPPTDWIRSRKIVAKTPARLDSGVSGRS